MGVCPGYLLQVIHEVLALGEVDVLREGLGEAVAYLLQIEVAQGAGDFL